MRISDWSSDVCSSDLIDLRELPRSLRLRERCDGRLALRAKKADPLALRVERRARRRDPGFGTRAASVALVDLRLADRAAVNQRLTPVAGLARQHQVGRSEEHTSELQSLMRISYAVFCLKKKNKTSSTK